MSHFTVTRSIDIQYAHRVSRHGGKCSTLHGHRGTVEVTVTGRLSASGADTDMVMDFGVIEAVLEKEIKGLLCHTTVLQISDPLVSILGGNDQASFCDFGVLCGGVRKSESSLARCVLLECAPTAERLAELCYYILSGALDDMTKTVKCVRFWETAKSMAQYPAC